MAMPISRIGPSAQTSAPEIDAPSSTTANSSNCFAEKLMPFAHSGPGAQTARIATPIRIAITSPSR